LSAGFALLAGGSGADDLIGVMTSLEVEENADAPGAFALTLPLSAVDGEIDRVGDPRLAPLAPIAVVARGSDDGPDECVFDGYVLAHSIRLSPGIVDSSLRVWGQDASWLLNMTEQAREWVDVSDATIAATIFGEYGIAPVPDNDSDDSPLHVEAGHSLLQRATDAQFLIRLARRAGKLFRVTNGSAPGLRSGIFARPKLDGSPVLTLVIGDTQTANAGELEIAWDVMRPTAVRGGQALLTAAGPAEADESEGLGPLESRGLADFAGEASTALVGAIVDDASELALRAQAELINNGFFVRCTGKCDVARLGAVLRVGTLVSLDAAGSLHSGNYYVWSVRHAITRERHEMRFELVRNAVGPAPAGGGLGIGL
jgi:hypothetical protein